MPKKSRRCTAHAQAFLMEVGKCSGHYFPFCLSTVMQTRVLINDRD